MNCKRRRCTLWNVRNLLKSPLSDLLERSDYVPTISQTYSTQTLGPRVKTKYSKQGVSSALGVESWRQRGTGPYRQGDLSDRAVTAVLRRPTEKKVKQLEDQSEAVENVSLRNSLKNFLWNEGHNRTKVSHTRTYALEAVPMWWYSRRQESISMYGSLY